LDFGLAKAMDNAPASATLSNSPTLSMAATQAGVILGTAAYMSPEQAKGFQADARSDVFSFGCVLYEMLTGRQAFQGETATEVLASVLVREPEWRFLPQNVNPRIPDLLRRCLEKNPKRRWQSTADLRAELEAIGKAPRTAATSESSRTRRNYWKVASILFFAGMIGFASVAAYFYKPVTDPGVIRFSLSPPDKTTVAQNGFVISPDGRNFAFAARDVDGGKVHLWIQPIDALSAKPIPGTEDVVGGFFWSPDSRSIAFFLQGKLKRVDISGGPVQTICDAATLRGGTWNSDGVIVVALELAGPLYRVPATGGKPVAVTKLENQGGHRYPHFLPDGQHFLYYVVPSNPENSGVYLGDLQGHPAKHVVAAETSAEFVPPGFLLFIRQGILLAQQFDARNLQTIGDPKPVAEPVLYSSGGANLGLASFSASTNGILSYRTGRAQAIEDVRLTLVDRSGKELEQLGKPGPYRGIDLSPDNKSVAGHRHDGLGGDLWIFQSPRPTPLRFTFDASVENASPVWSPDGKYIAFGSPRQGMWGLYRKPTDGSTGEELLLQDKSAVVLPVSWSPDGKFLVFDKQGTGAGGELWLLPLTGEKKPQPFLQSRFNESHAQVSPDGKWISYNSNESGTNEIYVRPFPSGAGRWQISTNGGIFSRWRADSKEIYYLTSVNNGKMMAVEVKASDSMFHYETAKELFDSKYLNYTHPGGGRWHTFAVFRDGQRFVIPRPVEAAPDTSSDSFVVVLNWQSALNKK
jgi:Tol biopolymer transport system component